MSSMSDLWISPMVEDYSNTEDPRETLQRFGVESEYVNKFCKVYNNLCERRGYNPSLGLGSDAISDLVEMVIRYKWMSEHYLASELCNREYRELPITIPAWQVLALGEFYDKNVKEHD